MAHGGLESQRDEVSSRDAASARKREDAVKREWERSRERLRQDKVNTRLQGRRPADTGQGTNLARGVHVDEDIKVHTQSEGLDRKRYGKAHTRQEGLQINKNMARYTTGTLLKCGIFHGQTPPQTRMRLHLPRN